MAWNLRCPLAPAEELSGVWTPGGKQHPMYLRRCTEARAGGVLQRALWVGSWAVSGV